MGSGVPKRGGVGAKTVPVMVVLPPFGHMTCFVQRFVQRPDGLPHTPVTPAPPQVSMPRQPPQSRLLPQPSPTMPQYLPVGWVQLIGVQDVAAQTPAVPPPPQVWPAGQAPQSSV